MFAVVRKQVKVDALGQYPQICKKISYTKSYLYPHIGHILFQTTLFGDHDVVVGFRSLSSHVMVISVSSYTPLTDSRLPGSSAMSICRVSPVCTFSGSKSTFLLRDE